MLKAPLSSTNLHNCSVVITLDLSQPGNVIESLQYWVQTLGGIISRELEEVKLENEAAFQLIQERVAEKWEKSEDRNKVKPMPVPFVIVCSKYDDFANKFDPMKKKQLCLALRYYAHLYGCDLVFASVKERLPFNLFKSMVNRHAFDLSEKVKIEKDPNNAINMYAASDSFLNIGEPDGSG